MSYLLLNRSLENDKVVITAKMFLLDGKDTWYCSVALFNPHIISVGIKQKVLRILSLFEPILGPAPEKVSKADQHDAVVYGAVSVYSWEALLYYDDLLSFCPPSAISVCLCCGKAYLDNCYSCQGQIAIAEPGKVYDFRALTLKP